MALKYLTASAYISLTGSNRLVLSAALPELVEVVDRSAVDLLLGLHAVGVVGKAPVSVISLSML
jgi:hypothetical protein